jgi:hypothetical protein
MEASRACRAGANGNGCGMGVTMAWGHGDMEMVGDSSKNKHLINIVNKLL